MKHKQLRLFSHLLIIVISALAVFPSTAHAYIDPGGGSLIWQVLIAALLTLGYIMRKYWRKLTGRKVDEDPDDEPQDKQPNGHD